MDKLKKNIYNFLEPVVLDFKQEKTTVLIMITTTIITTISNGNRTESYYQLIKNYNFREKKNSKVMKEREICI